MQSIKLNKEQIVLYLESTDSNCYAYYDIVQEEFLNLMQTAFIEKESEILAEEAKFGGGHDSSIRLSILNPIVEDRLADFLIQKFSDINIKEDGHLYGFDMELNKEVRIVNVIEDSHMEWIRVNSISL